MRPPRALLLLLLLALSATAAAAQVGVTTDILRGRVLGPDGRPAQGARVEAVSAESGVRRSTVTGADGRYTITFPDGGGSYRLRASLPGVGAATAAVAREADEEVLLHDFRLSEATVALEGIEVRANRSPPPGRGETGAQERTFPGELVNRLPLEDDDPARIAALSPGVTATGSADSLSARGGFSVAGQRSTLNQVTLDGASFGSALTGGQAGGGSPLGIPQEGIRGTRVVTTSFDVARGQFSGGQVAMTTRSGTNTTQGSFQYLLRDPTLQGGTTGSAGGGYTQNRLSGGVGGPIVRDRLFWFLSFSAQRRTDDLYSLIPEDRDAVSALGVAADSVARFLDVLQSRYGVQGRSLTGPFTRTGDAVSLLGRVDWAVGERHTLALRGHLNRYGQSNARIGFLETRENGGEVASDAHGAIATLTSRFGGGWINELKGSYTRDARDQDPYETVPEGRVRVSSVLADGSRGVSTLVFGGDRALPATTRERTLEVTDELSMLIRDSHRVKLGLLVNHSRFSQASSVDRLGSFTFHSLDDFAAGRPASFTRTLADRSRDGGGINAALYLGDTWRPRTEVQVTYGLRLEGSRFDGRPDYAPGVGETFGRETSSFPSEVRVSPRAGFSWRLNRQGEPLRLVRGGFGEFRGRAPFSLLASALDQTGRPTGESQLTCIGEAAPVPDWALYRQGVAFIPIECLPVAGETGPRAPERRPNVTLFQEGFGAPRSWRASLGFQGQVIPRLTVSVDAGYTRGVGLYGVGDLNLRSTPAFTVANEGGRPVFAPREAVSARTGEAQLAASRIHPDFAHVFEVRSDLESETKQLTVALNGLLPRRVAVQASYTHARSTDQSSFSCCSAQQGFASVPISGSPGNEWGTSDFERRHQLTAVVGVPLSQAVEVSLIGRASSGAPFTPMVGGDLNGDGARNDVAFVFDPASAPDTAVANGLSRLLASAPGRVRECLERQTGELARRNSCRGPWTASLDARATVRPQLPTLGRRLSLSVDVMNLPGGADLLLHGSGGLRGWGRSSFGGQDETLLYPRGFDPEAGRYRYEVNERFGQQRFRRGSPGSGFQVALSARVAVGPQQPGAFGLAGIAFGGGAGGPGGPGGGGRQGGFDRDAIVTRLFPQPISAIVALRDTLGLTAEQVTRLQAISDSLEARNAPIREEVRSALPEPAAQPAGRRGGQGQRGANLGDLFQRLGPRVEQARRNVATALADAEKVLTAEQWRRVPATIRSSGQGGFGGPGGQGGGNRPRGAGAGRPRGGTDD